MRTPLLAALLALLALPHACRTTASAESLPPHEPALPALSPRNTWFSSGGSGVNASVEWIDANTNAGAPAPRVARITVPRKVEPDYLVQFIANTTAPLRKGHACLLRLHMRTLESKDETTQSRVRVFVQRAGPSWDKSLDLVVRGGPRWQRFDLPFVSADDYAPGQAQFGLALGEAKQTVEVAGVELLAFGPGVAIKDLPRTRRNYAGREAEALWRRRAAERIAEHRMGDLEVTVVDAGGRPIPEAGVRVRMTRHAFGFGSAVTGKLVMQQDETGSTYRRHMLELFNRAVLENDLKWPAWDGQWGDRFDRRQTLAALAWLNERNIQVHGHVMVWPSWRHVPGRVEALKNDPDALRQAVASHITEQVAQAGRYIRDWDVVNEPFDNHQILDVLGHGVMVEWFKAAHAADPRIRLMINDYGILSTGGNLDSPHQAHYDKTIATLLERGAPLHGIGLQGHFGSNLTPPDKLEKIIDRFARFGLPLYVTEFDVQTDDEQLQADYTRDFMTVVFSRPEFDSFTMWGFWEAAHWRPQAAMFRRDWSEKPNAQAFRKLVFEDWWTDTTGRSDASGRFSTRGYCGEYEITVTKDQASRTQRVSLPPGGTLLTVRID